MKNIRHSSLLVAAVALASMGPTEEIGGVGRMYEPPPRPPGAAVPQSAFHRKPKLDKDQRKLRIGRKAAGFRF